MGLYIELVYIFLILFVGSVIQGMSGFGFGLFSVGLLSLFLPLKDVTLLLFTLTMFLSASIMVKFRSYIVWGELIFIIAAGLLGRASGFFFLFEYGGYPWMRKVLGAVLIGLVLFMAFSGKLKLRTSGKWNERGSAVLLGLLGGFVGGVFAAGGPFFVIYFLAQCEDKYKYHIHLQVTFFVTNLFSILLQGISNGINQRMVIYFLMGMAAVWTGKQIGFKLFGRISRDRVTYITCLIICVAGFRLFW